MRRPSTESIAAFFVFLGLGACQTRPGEPSCASSCMSSAISAASCFPTDLGCQCSELAKIGFLAGPCLLGSCGPDDLQILSAADVAVCSSFSAGKITKLEIATSTTAVRPAATGQMASPVLGLGPPPPQAPTVPATATASSTASASQPPLLVTSQTSTGEETKSAKLGSGGSAAIGLSGVVAGAGAMSIFIWIWQRKKLREADAEARAKESIPVDDLAAWVRENAKAEEADGADEEFAHGPGEAATDDKAELAKRELKKKQRYTGINMTGQDTPVELEVPGAVFELPGTVVRHEFEG